MFVKLLVLLTTTIVSGALILVDAGFYKFAAEILDLIAPNLVPELDFSWYILAATLVAIGIDTGRSPENEKHKKSGIEFKLLFNSKEDAELSRLLDEATEFYKSQAGVYIRYAADSIIAAAVLKYFAFNSFAYVALFLASIYATLAISSKDNSPPLIFPLVNLSLYLVLVSLLFAIYNLAVY